MSNLYNRLIKDSYTELLTLDNTGAGADTTLRAVMDGSGTATPLKLSTTTISLNNLSWPTGTPTQGNVLSVGASSVLAWVAPATGTVTSVGVTAGSSKVTVSGSPITTSGAITVDVSEANLTISNMTGTLATSHGGTGLTTLGTATQYLRVNAGATGLEYATLPAGNAGTVTSVAVAVGSNKLSVSGSPITSSGSITLDVTESNLTISNMGGTLATTHGGTGLTTIGTALQVLRVNSGGTGLEFAAASSGTVTSVGVTAGSSKVSVSGSPVTTSGSITVDVTEANLSHANIGGTVPTTKGGTGLTTIGTGLQYLRVNSGGTALEFATLTATGTVTSVGVTAGSSKVTVSGSPITTSGAITVDVAEAVLNLGNMTGTVGVTHGGTGLTSIGTTGQSIRVNTAGTGYEYYTPSAAATTDTLSPFLFLGC